MRGAIALQTSEVMQISSRLERTWSERGFPPAILFFVKMRSTPMAGNHFDAVEFLTTPGKGKTITTYRTHELIFRHGELPFKVYYLLEGSIKLAAPPPGGREAIVGIVEPGQFFGAHHLFEQRKTPRTVTAETLQPSKVTGLSQDLMRSTIIREPAFSQMFMQYLLQRTSEVETHNTVLIAYAIEHKLAYKLIYLSHGGRDIITGIKQETLADLLGTTRATINKYLVRFRKAGFINSNSKGIMVHPSLLEAVLQPSITEDDPDAPL